MYFEIGPVLFQFIEDWSQFFQRCNWYTFRFAHFEVEDERNMGSVEFSLVVLGLGLRVSWNYCETEFRSQLTDQITEIQKELK